MFLQNYSFFFTYKNLNEIIQLKKKIKRIQNQFLAKNLFEMVVLGWLKNIFKNGGLNRRDFGGWKPQRRRQRVFAAGWLPKQAGSY